MLIRRIFSFTLCILLYSSAIWSQVPERSTDYDRFENIAISLEKKYSVKIIYKPEWFDTDLYPKNIIELPLPEALSAITKSNGFSVIYVEDYAVIVPTESSAYNVISYEDQLIVIGNPAEFGRYTMATLSGKIMDGNSGEALTGAVVYNEKTLAGTATDRNGNYSLTLPVGEHILRLSYIGYEDSYKRIKIMATGVLDFELFEQMVRLDEVTIMARKAEANVTRTQMSVINLDAKTIKEMPGAFGEKDIIKSLSLLPGIQTPGEFGTGFSVRGGSNDQNLILIEDMPLFNTAHLFGLTSIVNPDMVTNATLLKAGIPARYGERVSSVMDIRVSGLKPEKTSLKGGIGLINSRLSFETPLFDKKASFSLGGRSSYSDWLLRSLPDTDLMNSSAGFNDLTSIFSLALNGNHILTLFGYRSSDDFSFSNHTDHSYSSILGSFRLNSTLGEKLQSRLSGGISDYKYKISEGREVDPRNAFEMNSGIVYKNLKWHFDYYLKPEQTLDAGLNIIHYQISPGSVNPLGDQSFISPRIIQNEQAFEIAGYFSNSMNFSPRLSSEMGIRFTQFVNIGPVNVFNYQDNNPDGPENITDTVFFPGRSIAADYAGLDPRLSFRYIINKTSSLKAGYIRTRQFIHIVSNTSVMTPYDTWKLSDKYIKPLISNQLTLGYFKNLKNNSIETSAEFYLKNYKNLLEYKNGANLLMNEHIETELLHAEGYSTGIEMFVKKNTGKVTGWTSYTLSSTMVQTTSDQETEQINQNRYYPANHHKPHNLIVNATWHITRRWKLNGTFNYSTGRPLTLPERIFNYDGNELINYSDRNKYKLPDYHRLDIAINYYESLKINKPWKGSWSLSVINIYGRKNAYSVFYQKDQPNTGNNFNKFGLYKLYIIGKPLPTLTYNFIF